MARKQNYQTIAWFYDLKVRQRLDLNPPYQRRSVWNQEYRDYFIDTVLLGYPSPAIFLFQEISEAGTATFRVVDGKQRLETLFDFIENGFPVSEVAKRVALRGKEFTSLDPADKIAFWEYEFSVEYLPTNDETIISNIFDRINRNVSKLTAQELRHARYSGIFITAAEDQTAWLQQLFEGYAFPRFAAKSKSQMKDVELTAQIFLLLEDGVKSYSQEALDQVFADRDSSWEARDEVVAEFQAVAGLVRELLNTSKGSYLSKSRFQNQADFYSLCGAIAELRRANEMPPLETAADRLASFIDAVETQSKDEQDEDSLAYYNAARSASSDPGPRKKRIEIIKRVLTSE